MCKLGAKLLHINTPFSVWRHVHTFGTHSNTSRTILWSVYPFCTNEHHVLHVSHIGNMLCVTCTHTCLTRGPCHVWPIHTIVICRGHVTCDTYTFYVWHIHTHTRNPQFLQRHMILWHMMFIIGASPGRQDPGENAWGLFLPPFRYLNRFSLGGSIGISLLPEVRSPKQKHKDVIIGAFWRLIRVFLWGGQGLKAAIAIRSSNFEEGRSPNLEWIQGWSLRQSPTVGWLPTKRCQIWYSIEKEF